MKYQPPAERPYESGLTSRLMYDIMEELLTPITAAEIRSVYSKYSGRASEKRWEVPKVRSQLEEFVQSYFLSDLDEPLPGFDDIIIENGSKKEEKLREYFNLLKDHYGSADTAEQAFKDLLHRMASRVNVYVTQTKKTRGIDGNEILKANIVDGFAHTAPKYQLVPILMGRILRES